MVASGASKSLRTTIDRSSPIPYYVQLKEALRAPIEQGLWQPGDQIPGESELCHLFDVSRMVVRQALNELNFEGLITRVIGVFDDLTDTAQRMTQATNRIEPNLGNQKIYQPLVREYINLFDLTRPVFDALAAAPEPQT